jgi:hypothetical protein
LRRGINNCVFVSLTSRFSAVLKRVQVNRFSGFVIAENGYSSYNLSLAETLS